MAKCLDLSSFFLAHGPLFLAIASTRLDVPVSPAPLELKKLLGKVGVTAVGRSPTEVKSENDRQHSGLTSAATIRGVVLLESIPNDAVSPCQRHVYARLYSYRNSTQHTEQSNTRPNV